MDPQSHSIIGMAFCFVMSMSLRFHDQPLYLIEAGIKKNFQATAPALFTTIIN